jgi:hypothetical protein
MANKRDAGADEGTKARRGDVDPQSEHDWTIHALNIHGAFFERWCEDIVAKAEGWKVKGFRNPVAFRERESELDIRAEHRIDNSDILTLAIECKKNNPEFVNWLFLRQTQENLPTIHTWSAWSLLSQQRQENSGWLSATQLVIKRLEFPVADIGRETRSSYVDWKRNEKTRTSNKAITDAAYQVALATESTINEEAALTQVLGKNPKEPMPHLRMAFLPVIVTSARLLICDFSASDVNPATGEIAFDRAQISEHPRLIFQYAIPAHLHKEIPDIASAWKRGTLYHSTRLSMLVVHSEAFRSTLDYLAKNANVFMG